MTVRFRPPREKFLEDHLMAELNIVIAKDILEAPNQRRFVVKRPMDKFILPFLFHKTALTQIFQMPVSG